ncbi:hypothetical protein PG997_005685 [Apiospora hydei]|uniref:Uncharacterized protein n=1 Tax=Apiospora hydei TaxID=1337664 RepID=A0ABR1WLK7_9PEZI
MPRQSKQTTNRIVFGRGSFPRSIGGWMLEVVLSEDFVPYGFGMLQLEISNLSGSYLGKPRFNIEARQKKYMAWYIPDTGPIGGLAPRLLHRMLLIIRNPICGFESSIKLDQAGNLFVSTYRDAREIAMPVSIVPIARPKEAGVSGVLSPQSTGCRPSERTRDLPGRGSDRSSWKIRDRGGVTPGRPAGR